MIKLQKIAIMLILLLVVGKNRLNAQISNLSDISGTVLTQNSYVEVSGSPYLHGSWRKGNVTFSNGKKINGVALKYDQVKDELLFAGKNNEEYYFNEAVAEFTLAGENEKLENSSVFRNGFPSLKKLTNTSFFEIIVDGEVKLLKKNVKTITETKEFNSATTTRSIDQNLNYYIFKTNALVQLKKGDLKGLANALDDQKAPAIIDFSQKNKLNVSKEEDLKKIVTYYISIK